MKNQRFSKTYVFFFSFKLTLVLKAFVSFAVKILSIVKVEYFLSFKNTNKSAKTLYVFSEVS